MNNKLKNFSDQSIENFENGVPKKITGAKFRGMLYGWDACLCKHCRKSYWTNGRTWKKYRGTQYK